MFLAFLGIIFVFLIRTINSYLLILKGVTYDLAIWFFIYSMIAIFRVLILMEIPSRTCISNMIGASIWGIMVGYFLDLFNTKLGIVQ
jgi:hypothetical protein